MFLMKATGVGGRRRCGLGVKAGIGSVMVVCWAEGMGGGVRWFAVGGMMEGKRRKKKRKGGGSVLEGKGRKKGGKKEKRKEVVEWAGL